MSVFAVGKNKLCQLNAASEPGVSVLAVGPSADVLVARRFHMQKAGPEGATLNAVERWLQLPQCKMCALRVPIRVT